MYDQEPIGPGSSTLKAKVASGTDGVYTKIPERELNLAVSLLLRDELISRGYGVVMIREVQDVQISNSQRAVMANNYNADALIRVLPLRFIFISLTSSTVAAPAEKPVQTLTSHPSNSPLACATWQGVSQTDAKS